MLKRLFAVLALAAAALPGAAATLGDEVAGAGSDALLPADEAFVLGAERQADATVVLHWTIADDYYLYRDRTEITLNGGGEASLGEPRFAPARTKDDPFFGETAVYYGEASVRVPLRGTPAEGARLEVTYQGCNEPIGVCYPPIDKTLEMSSIALAQGSGPSSGTTGGPAGASEQGRIAAALASWTLGWTVLAFVGFGLLLALTPCVFPMLPILAGVIAGGDPHAGHARRGGGLALVFVLAMALAYAAVGVVVGLTGASIQAWFQQPWVLGLLAAVFVVLALAMFGLFDLQSPGPLRHALEARTRRLGGSGGGAAALGATSAVVVGPCVTPPLIGALLFIAESGDPVTGGLALFALGLGMGLPLIAFGTFAGHYLPRAGAWMTRVQAAFGVLLLAVAVWLVQRVVPVPVAMVLWSVLLIVTGVQLGALSAVDGGWRRLWKGLGTVLVLYGALLLVGAAAGGQSLLQPLRGVLDGGGTATAGREFRAVEGVEGLRRALTEARRSDRPVMLDVYADWCVSCKELEAFTFPDERVRRALGDAMLLRTDVTANDAGDSALLERYDLYGPPAILFFGPDGVERRGYRVVGFMGPQEFARHVRRALPEAGA
ncbi:MAG: protein-disulfide reductase DsbD [Halofilum sp. (in: g-proteobacteria)]|nr:protein-disulfide reductase DsbD [Halofilum sp. (in: g-proteobacteria)]